MRISDWSSDVCSSDLTCFTRTISRTVEKTRNNAAASSSKSCPNAWDRAHATRRGEHPHFAASNIPKDACPRILLACQILSQLRRLCIAARRSEEHTSELQSLMRISYAVFCLNKKKTILTKRQYNQK